MGRVRIQMYLVTYPAPFPNTVVDSIPIVSLLYAFLESFNSHWGLYAEVGVILFPRDYVGGLWIERSICFQ